jgi:hypothetical protein
LKATFCDFNSSSHCVYIPYYSNSVILHLFINTTFINLNTSYSYCPTINIIYAESPVRIINCTFNNLHTTSASVNAGAFYMIMTTSYAYIFSGNSISDCASAKSSIYLTGSVNSLNFSDNIFKNIESTSTSIYGGVYILFFFYLFYLFYILFKFFLFFYFFIFYFFFF